ncbi:hypothetical protein OPT61_g355 [Boeremia exigua]|uniref:Uncharacterized protein n=1 Tax=Boeremia exigua TaxID=749465 RepID=A0ACC2IU65_9PLEO|nr:hypothetical protein OPT61_g355 [Boeremia exigua]
MPHSPDTKTHLNTAALKLPATMLSAIAPRKDSAQNFKERLGPVHCHSPVNSSPLANSFGPDIVTNDARAKEPDIMRVLSPMRPRRTPVLVNAPDVHWRLARSPCLRNMSSLDTVMTLSSTSESSSTHQTPVAPLGIAFASPSASSLFMVIPEDEEPANIPLPASPLAQIDTTYDASERYLHQPHPLSPITEVASAPSIRSSILDLRVQDIGTAERRRVASVRRHHVSLISTSGCSLDSLRSGRSSEESCCSDCEECAPENVTRTMPPAVGGQDVAREEVASLFSDHGCRVGKRNRRGLCGSIARLKERARGLGDRALEAVAEKIIIRALARVL